MKKKHHETSLGGLSEIDNPSVRILFLSHSLGFTDATKATGNCELTVARDARIYRQAAAGRKENHSESSCKHYIN